MYYFKLLSRKIIKIVPLLLVLGAACHVFGPFGKALSVTLMLVSAEIMAMYTITRLYYKNEEKSSVSEPLTKSKTVRTSIVREFAGKYALGLTDEQTNLIVSASYSSLEWEKEIQMMSREYSVVNQWYVCGKEEWLHLYLKAFRNISITSDFEMQKKIVMKAFSEIVAEPFSDYARISDCIESVNEKYYTAFDEISFMMTCKYMKEQGYEVKLPDGIVLKHRSEMDELIKKWNNCHDKGATRAPELSKALAQGRDAVKRVKEASSLVARKDMSGKLERLENVLRQIFGAMDKHPEKLSDLQRFMNYYLPPILKAVETYKELEIQNIQGENAEKSKKEIEENLDVINLALENLAGNLYEEASMDVSVDLSVLNTLMTNDGLKKDIKGISKMENEMK